MTDHGADQKLITCRYTAEDYVAAYKLSTAPLHRKILLLLLVATIIFIIFDYARGIGPAEMFRDAIGPVIGVGSFLALLQYFFLPQSARRSYARQPIGQLEYRIALRPDGLETHSDRGHVFMRWEDFIRWRMNDKTTVIYLGPTLFQSYPSRLAELGFPIEELRASLAREVGPPARW